MGMWDIPLVECDITDNQSPSSLHLSANQIAESRPAGTVVGWLRTVDPDVDQSHAYTLHSWTDVFEIEATDMGSRLRTTGIHINLVTIIL